MIPFGEMSIWQQVWFCAVVLGKALIAMILLLIAVYAFGSAARTMSVDVDEDKKKENFGIKDE